MRKCWLRVNDVNLWFFQMFLFTYNHPRMAGPTEKAAAMTRIKDILREANFSGAAFPFSKEYGSWETDLVRRKCEIELALRCEN